MLHKLLGTILRLPTLSGNNDVAGGVELVVALNNAMEQWSYSYCDRSYFYCDVVKAGALTIARGDQ